MIDAHAAFTTVGAVAMQGYRQSEARLGEVAVVIGLGLVGQLLVQLLARRGRAGARGRPVRDDGAGWPSRRVRRAAARPRVPDSTAWSHTSPR